MIIIRRNKSIRYTYPRVKMDFGISMFFYDPESGKDYVTNQLGALIWSIIDNDVYLNNVIEEIYKTGICSDHDMLKEDIIKLCNVMVKRNLANYLEYNGG